MDTTHAVALYFWDLVAESAVSDSYSGVAGSNTCQDLNSSSRDMFVVLLSPQ